MSSVNDHPLDLPIVDALSCDHQHKTWAVTFVPCDDLSAEPKLVVAIPFDSVEGKQIGVWLDEFRGLLGQGGAIQRIVHAGGGDYTFLFEDGSHLELSDPGLVPEAVGRIYDGLQYVSRAAENAYRIVQINLAPTGS